MVSSIGQSFFSSTLGKIAIGACLGEIAYYTGIRGVLVALGGYLAIQSWFGSSKPVQLPQNGLPSRVDESLLLKQPIGNPPSIQWRDNSCFLSSAIWPLMNEPAILGELPVAIVNRVNPNLIGAICDAKPEKTERLFAINHASKLTSEDCSFLRKTLQELEMEKSLNTDSLKELLSLLELHQLVCEAQAREYIPGEKINSVRQMVARVNPYFHDLGANQGDSSQVFSSLAALIFGKKYHQWGYFQLGVKQSENLISDTLKQYLLLNQQHQPHSAPPFLALQVTNPQFGITPELNFTLDENLFRDGRKAQYELVGISRNLQAVTGLAHYDGVLRTQDGQIFHCDDLQSKPIRATLDRLKESAVAANLLIYRKID